MSTTYGLTVDGFITKPLQVIRDDLNTALQAAFGASIDLGDKSIFGQLVGIIAERLALLWELAELVNSSQDPDKATGASLDALCALTGTVRPPATYSSAMMTLFGAPTTLVTAGTTFQTASTQKDFASIVDATIVALPAWAVNTTYAVGDRVTRTVSTVVTIYECIVGGLSDPATPVSGTGTDILDGTVHWKSIASALPTGSGAVDVLATCTETGPITAVAGDITTIINDVFGLVSVTNLADAAAGQDLTADEQLRVLRDEELSGEGHSPIDAIRAAILKWTSLGVIAVTVFENTGDTTDADGMPPHSVEALVRTTPDWIAGDPRDQVIYDTLLQNVSGGIATTGTQAGASVDSQNISHVMKFSRPTEVPIYVVLNVTVDPEQWPADGVAQIQSAITTWGAGLSTGKDAVASALVAKAFSVAGVLDVTCFIGTAPSPSSSTTVVIDTRHLATYDTGRIAVNVTNGTP